MIYIIYTMHKYSDSFLVSIYTWLLSRKVAIAGSI